MTPKNGFLLFIASCLSGCGQMYQGYMKRGVSLLLALPWCSSSPPTFSWGHWCCFCR